MKSAKHKLNESSNNSGIQDDQHPLDKEQTNEMFTFPSDLPVSNSFSAIWNEILKNAAPPQDRALGSEVVDKVEGIKELQQLLSDLKSGTDGDTVWPQYSKLVFAIDSVHQVIESFHLPTLCDDILDLTDAGPGMGISNL